MNRIIRMAALAAAVTLGTVGLAACHPGYDSDGDGNGNPYLTNHPTLDAKCREGSITEAGYDANTHIHYGWPNTDAIPDGLWNDYHGVYQATANDQVGHGEAAGTFFVFGDGKTVNQGTCAYPTI